MKSWSDDQIPAGRVFIGLIIALLLLALLTISGCKVKQYVASSDTITVVREVPHDSLIYISDSSGLAALIECDSLGKIHLKEIQDYYKGQFVKPKVEIRNNYVEVACIVDSAQIYLTWKSRDRSTVITTVQVVKENYLTSWQWFQVWLGRILMALVIVSAGWQVLKRYTSLKLPF